MKQWKQYKELMDHEIPDLNIKLTDSGYKLDGKKGIKIGLKFNKLKSVDYISDDDKLKLVEFSDLYSQQHSLLQKIISIKKVKDESVFVLTSKREQIKAAHSQVSKELSEKYMGTKQLIDQMQLTDPCAELKLAHQDTNTPSYYHIVISNPNKNIPAEDLIDLNRFFEHLASTVSEKIPNQWNVEVRVDRLG